MKVKLNCHWSSMARHYLPTVCLPAWNIHPLKHVSFLQDDAYLIFTAKSCRLSFNVTLSTQQLKRRATGDVWSRGRSYIVLFHLSYSSINTYLYTNWMIGKIQMAHNKWFNWNNRLYTSTWNDFYRILAGQLAQLQ